MPARFANFNRGRRAGPYRSGIEERFAQELQRQHIPFKYEEEKYRYQVTKIYTPDFIITTPFGPIYLEVKGWWPAPERSKILAVKQSNPELRIVMVLQRPNAAINHGSKTSLSVWCDRKGIEWAPFPVPPEQFQRWMTEPPASSSRATSPAPAARVQMELPFMTTGTSTASPASV